MNWLAGYKAHKFKAQALTANSAAIIATTTDAAGFHPDIETATYCAVKLLLALLSLFTSESSHVHGDILHGPFSIYGRIQPAETTAYSPVLDRV